MSGSLRRAILLVPLLACACATHRVPIEMEMSRDLPRPCWVVLTDGERIRLDQARLTPDSVVGWRHEGGRVALARDRVDHVEERRVTTEDAIGWAALSGLVISMVLGTMIVLAVFTGGPV